MKCILKNAWIALLGSAMLLAACGKENREEPKSAACDILSFSVGGEAWTINGATIVRAYPAGTTAATAAPAITLSPGATVNPPAAAAQNFFTAEGVAYTVTAEDGATKKTYVAKATIDPATGCDILSFSVDGEAWTIDGATITHAYPAGTAKTPRSPVIALSPGATANPPSGEARDFFAEGGVAYTVTAEDGRTTKTYTARATVELSAACEILSFSVDDAAWTIDGANITRVYPSETTATSLTPVIALSPGATVNPPSGEAQDFFTEEGVAYTVTAEDGETTKPYIIKATIEPAYSGATGDLAWAITGPADNYTLTISGVGATADYLAGKMPPWQQYGIKTAVIRNGASRIGTNAFRACSGLTSVTIPSSVQTIDEAAFFECAGLTSVDIPNSVQKIGVSAFYKCSGLTSVAIPNSVQMIDSVTFSNCTGLTSVTIPSSVKAINMAAFYQCTGLTDVTIPESVEVIGLGAFYQCTGLTSVTIPNSVQTIGISAFFLCSRLASVTIGSSVQTINDFAFGSCTALTTVTNLNPEPQAIVNAFLGVNTGAATLKVPAAAVDAYKDANVWKSFKNIEAIP